MGGGERVGGGEEEEGGRRNETVKPYTRLHSQGHVQKLKGLPL